MTQIHWDAFAWIARVNKLLLEQFRDAPRNSHPDQIQDGLLEFAAHFRALWD